jgi:hypothetical protein
MLKRILFSLLMDPKIEFHFVNLSRLQATVPASHWNFVIHFSVWSCQSAASSAAKTVDSGWRVNSRARTRGRIVGLGVVSQSRRAGETRGSSVR